MIAHYLCWTTFLVKSSVAHPISTKPAFQGVGSVPGRPANATVRYIMVMETKYLRMIQGMKTTGQKEWTVYILRCGDGSLYTGIAKDLQARVRQHGEGRGATYTRSRLPVTLLYQQEGLTHSEALIREAQIKAMPRSRKEEIIFEGKEGDHRKHLTKNPAP
jgi:predicted GIY-YIG superfamily endonuclease